MTDDEGNQSYILHPWNIEASIRKQRCFLKLADDRSFSIKNQPKIYGEISGYYAKYPEGVFFIVWTKDGGIYFGWKQKIFELREIKEFSWERRLTDRVFRITGPDSVDHTFQYDRLLLAPWRVITDFVVRDEWWDLQCNLPSWVDSSLSLGRLKPNDVPLMTYPTPFK